jgi:hypothetical protein
MAILAAKCGPVKHLQCASHEGGNSQFEPYNTQTRSSGKHLQVIASDSREHNQHLFLCWQFANAPVLPGPAQPYHIDRRMPLWRQATGKQQTVIF